MSEPTENKSHELPTLPQGWTGARVSELAAPQAGAITDGPFGSNLKSSHYTESGPRVVRLQNIGDGVFRDEYAHIAEEHFATLRKHEVEAGDVLVAMLGEELPRACLAPPSLGTAIVKADCVRFRVDRVAVSPDYVAGALNSHPVRQQAAALVHGVGRPRLGVALLRDLRVPLAPLGEQQKIVEAVDSYLTRLTSATEGLQRVQANLKRYRASVLKAAVEGRLVPTEAEISRNEGRTYEPASVLLDRILTERRRRWEEAELAKMKAKGTTPKDDKWKARYLEPTPPDTTNLPPLPEGWCWTTVDQLISGIEAGNSFKCLERPPSIPEIGVVKVSAVTWGEYDENESKTCTDEAKIERRLFIQRGDLLFSRANTFQLVGACVIAERVTRQIMLSDKILRIHALCGIERWMLWALRSERSRREIERLSTGNQESMRNIGQERMRQIPLPLPPQAELSRVIDEIESHNSDARRVDSVLERNLARIASLRSAVLRWAFEGKLVDQDPNDEPASVLLERIRAERAAAAETFKSSRKSRSAPVPAPVPAPPPAPEPARTRAKAPTRASAKKTAKVSKAPAKSTVQLDLKLARGTPIQAKPAAKKPARRRPT